GIDVRVGIALTGGTSALALQQVRLNVILRHALRIGRPDRRQVLAEMLGIGPQRTWAVSLEQYPLPDTFQQMPDKLTGMTGIIGWPRRLHWRRDAYLPKPGHIHPHHAP